MPGEDTLTYMITAHDLATPVFKAFGGQVEAMSKQVSASLATMNKSLADTQAQLAKTGEAAKASADAQATAAKKTETASVATAGHSDKTKGLSSDLQDARADVQKNAAALTDLGDAASVASLKTQSLADDQKKMGTETATAAESVDKSAVSTKSAAANAAALGSSLETTTTRFNTAKKAADDHANSMTKLGTNVRSAGSDIETLGGKLTKMALPLVAIGAGAVLLSTKFQAAMEQVHTQAGYSQASVDSLSKSVLAMSGKVAETPEELAQGLYHIASVGIPAAQAMSVLQAAAIGANISGASFDDTANALVTTLKNFPDTAGGASAIMAQLNAIVGQGNLHMQDLVGNLGKVVPAAKAMGLQLNDVGAGLDVMTSHGMGASQSATALKMAITTMGAPTAAAAAQLKTIGLTSTQLATDMRSPGGFLKAITDLKTHLVDSGDTAVQQAAVLSHAFGGGRTGTGVMLLTQNVDDLRKVYDKLPEGAAAIKQLQAAQDAWEKTTQGQMDHVKSALSAVGVEVGNSLVPVVVPAFKELGTMVTSVADAFVKLPSPVKDGVVALVGFAAVAGPLFKILGPGVKLMGSAIEGLGKLGGAAHVPGAGGASSVGSVLSGGSSSGVGIYGFSGTMLRVGSEANPIAVMMVGKGMGGSLGSSEEGKAATTVEEDAGAGGGVAAEAEGGAGMLAGVGGKLMGGLGVAGIGTMGSQVVGSMVGGKAGQDISGIGTGASLGAGIGTMIEPGIGTAIGAGVGAGLTIAEPGIKKILGDIFDDPSYGEKAADSLSKGFGGANADNLKKQIASALDAAHKIQDSTTVTKSSGGRFATETQTVTPLTDAQKNAMQKDFMTAGQDDAKALEAGWSQYKFQSEPIMFTQMKTELKGMPPQSQAAAAASALAYSQGLEQSGKLPVGSTQKMLTSIEALYPPLTAYLGTSAKQAVANFTVNFDLTQAETNLKATMDKMRGDFPQVVQAMDTTTGDMQTKAAAVRVALMSIVDGPTSTKAMKAQAKADLQDLAASADTSFSTMLATVQKNTVSITQAVSSNSAQALQIGGKNFDALASAIASYVGSGAEATQKGLQNITDQVNAALKGFGETGLTPAEVKAVGPTALAALVSGQVSVGGLLSPHATGGRVPGPVGPDNWTLVGPTGQAQAMVGGGELLIANRHTEAAMSAATMAVYGQTAGQMVAGESTPHSAPGRARGGRVPGFATGGVIGEVDQQLAAAGYDKIAIAGILGNAMQESSMNPNAPGGGLWQQISNFGAGTGGSVAAQTARMLSQIGGIRAALNAATTPGQAATIFEQGFEKAGIPALANRINYANEAFAGGLIGGSGGGGASAPTITAPTVTSGGAMGSLVKAVLGKAVTAAQSFIDSKAPVAAASGAGLGSVPNFPIAPGKVPASVQRAMDIARMELGKPYILGGYGIDAPGLDCSGYVSTVLAGAGLDPAGHLLTGGLKTWGDQGPGKWITVGVLGADSGPTGHTMMEIDGTFFESGGHSSAGPHIDPTWSSPFTWWRHPPGLSTGGEVGDPNHQLSAAQFAKIAGKAEYAGGFASGGSFTAHGPTLALFGEGGRAEDVYAVPHGATGTKTDSAAGTWGYNSLTGQIEYHDASEWGLIKAEEAKAKAGVAATTKEAAKTKEAATKAAAAAKKAQSAFMGTDVTDTLTIGGHTAGSIFATRTALNKEGLPEGGNVGLLSGTVAGAKPTGQAAITSALSKQLSSDSLDQVMTLVKAMASGITKHGPEAKAEQQFNKLTASSTKLNDQADKLTAQAKTLHDDAMTKHGVQRQKMMDEFKADTDKAGKDHKQAAVDTVKATSLGNQISGSPAGKALAQAITSALKGVSAEFTGQQSQFSKTASVATALQGMAPGTSLKSLGLSNTQLSAMGMSPSQAAAMIGTGNNPAAVDQQQTQQDQAMASTYAGDAAQLQTLYKASLKTHNKTLQNSLLTQLDAVTEAQVAADAQLQQDRVKLITDTAAQFSTQSANIAASGGLQSQIGGLNAGTSIAGQFSPAVMATLGISDTGSGSSGAGLAALQAQGPLSAAQMSNAIGGIGSSTANAEAQIGPLQQELNYYQSQLPNLSGTDQQNAITAMQGLAGQILTLDGTIQANNASITALIQSNDAAIAAQQQAIASNISGAGGVLGAIQNLAPGTDLGAAGISSAALIAAGIDPSQVAGMEGSGLSYLGNQETLQNGMLTPTQIAAATSGTNALNANLSAQIAPDQTALNTDIASLGTMTPGSSDALAMQGTIIGLINTLVGLQTSIQANNTALTNLTMATVQNTTATGQMTGTVGYTYQNQNFVAGFGAQSSSMTSDSPLDITTGV